VARFGNSCGEIFCGQCCNYEMRLNTQAKHDPVQGVFARVCRACFESREGFLQELGTPSARRLTKPSTLLTPACAPMLTAFRITGPVRQLTQHFVRLRQPALERGDMELNRLIMRLDKVSYAECPRMLPM